MNEKIKAHVIKYNKNKGYGTTDRDIVETIMESEIWRGEHDSHRWWSTFFGVAKVDGMLIGFEGAETTGDESAEDKGWEFDEGSICEVEVVEVTTIVYKRHKEQK